MNQIIVVLVCEVNQEIVRPRNLVRTVSNPAALMNMNASFSVIWRDTHYIEAAVHAASCSLKR